MSKVCLVETNPQEIIAVPLSSTKLFSVFQRSVLVFFSLQLYCSGSLLTLLASFNCRQTR